MVATRLLATVLAAILTVEGAAIAQGPGGGRGFPRDARPQATARGHPGPRL